MNDSQFEQLKILVEQTRKVSGNEALSVFRKLSTGCKDLICIIYDKASRFWIKSGTIKKAVCRVDARLKHPASSLTLCQLLVRLRDRVLVGKNATDWVKVFMRGRTESEQELILAAIDKDLRIGFGSAKINKVLGTGSVTDFKLIQGYTFHKHRKKLLKGSWFMSEKLDGVRTVIRVDEDGVPTLYSRQGKRFPHEHIEELGPIVKQFTGAHPGVYDGETLVKDEQGKSYFKITNSIMCSRASASRKKNRLSMAPGQRLMFFSWSYIPSDVFDATRGPITFSKRYKMLKEYLPTGAHVSIVEQHPVLTEEHAQKFASSIMAAGGEGAILQKDVPYRGARSPNTLKIKPEHDAEFIVKNCTLGWMQPPGTHGKQQEVLAHFDIEYKGNTVHVGGGLDWEERVRYTDGSLVGQVVTVQYMEETERVEKGVTLYSLRHPRLKIIHGKKRTV